MGWGCARKSFFQKTLEVIRGAFGWRLDGAGGPADWVAGAARGDVQRVAARRRGARRQRGGAGGVGRGWEVLGVRMPGGVRNAARGRWARMQRRGGGGLGQGMGGLVCGGAVRGGGARGWRRGGGGRAGGGGPSGSGVAGTSGLLYTGCRRKAIAQIRQPARGWRWWVRVSRALAWRLSRNLGGVARKSPYQGAGVRGAW